MGTEFDYNIPIYIQLVEQIKIDIISGKMQEAFVAAGYDASFGKVTVSNEGTMCYYVRGGSDAWLAENTAENWGEAVITKPVAVDAMHKWLAANPGAFIAALN